MRIKVTKNSFSSGEISPLLRGRTDIQQYADGVEEMNNFLIRQQGGISKRPGTKFIGEIVDQLKKVRLQKFVYNNEQSYTLEFSPLKIRVLKNEGFVTDNDVAITGATQASVVVVTSNAHGFSNGDILTISNVVGMSQLNGKDYKVSNKTTNTFELTDMLGNNINSTAFSAYTSGGVANKHIIIDTPYTEDDLEGLSFAQSNDVLFIASESHQPRKVSRTNNISWTIEEVANLDGPYQAENLTDATLNPSGTTGVINVVASVSLFSSTDVGRVIRIAHDGSSPLAGYGYIKTFTDASNISVSLSSNLGSSSATELWRLGAWSESTGYSGTVTFHQNRLWFGGTSTEPNTFWASKTDDYENFEPNNPSDAVVSDDNGLRFQIASEETNSIQWMRSAQQFFIGTKGGQYAIRSSGASITPSDINVIRQNGYGSSIVEPHLISNSLIYTDRTTRKIMEMAYNYDNDVYDSKEISVIANHILRQGVRAIYTSYRQAPDNIIWYVLESGRLVGMTYLKEQNIIAFHNHDIGGTYESETVNSGYVIEGETYRIKSIAGSADFTTIGASSNTVGNTFVATDISPTWGSGSLAKVSIAQVKAITTIPSALEQTDITYLVVKRTINGQTRQYIEYLEDDDWANHDQDKDNLFFVDCGLDYSGGAISTVSGLSHLEGETVSIVANNGSHPDRVVTNGAVTLQAPATKIKIGYNYAASCKTLPVDVQGDIGSSQGSTKRISKIIARFWNSLGLQVGQSLDKLDDIVFRSSLDRMDISPPLYTGDKNILLNMDYNSEAGFYIRQDKPFPCNVLFITTEVRSNL